ncbi:MAG: S4 domain-containing protein [Bacteroidota bacterium]
MRFRKEGIDMDDPTPQHNAAQDAEHEELLHQEEGKDTTDVDDGADEDGWYEHKRLKADPGQKLMRIDAWLSIVLKNKSRTMIKNATLAGCIRVNGKTIKPSYKIKPLDVVTIVFPNPPPPELAPEDIPLQIDYEDDDFLILNKKPGMVVHPGVGNWTGTMLHALLLDVQREGIHFLTTHMSAFILFDWILPLM